MTAPDLLPCPFCGGDANLGYRSAYSVDSGSDFVGCNDCCCMIEFDEPKWNARTQSIDSSSRAEAIATWNTRAPLAEALAVPEVQALVEAAKRALQFTENTESELGMTLESGDMLRAAIRAIGERADG